MGKHLTQVQRDAILFCVNHRRSLVRMPTGTGKTLVALSSIKVLRDRELASNILIVAKPKEIEAFISKDNNVYSFGMYVIRDSRDFDLFQVGQYKNYDIVVVTSSLIQKFADKFLKMVMLSDIVIIDELHNYRVYTAKTTQVMIKAFKYYKGRVLALTATPFYKQLEDAYSLFQIVEPRLFPSFMWFMNKFVVYEERNIKGFVKSYTGGGVTRSKSSRVIRDKLGYKNIDEFRKMVDPYVFYSDATRFTISTRLIHYSLSDLAGVEYDKLIKGIGVDKCYKVGFTFDTNGEERVITRTRTESVWSRGGEEVHPHNLLIGQSILFNSQYCTVRWIKESDAVGDYIVRLLKTQLFTSSTEEKYKSLRSVIDSVRGNSDLSSRGCLVYFQYKESLQIIKSRLERDYTGCVIKEITGNTADVGSVVKRLSSDDIVLITRSATQSLNFYFQSVIVYESITVPGLLEQFVGRCTRNDASFDEVDLYFIVGIDTAEEYFHQRVVYLTDQSPGAMLSGKLPSIAKFQGLNFNNKQLSFRDLKDKLLWRR